MYMMLRMLHIDELFFILVVLLELAHESHLLGFGLEATVSELGACVDELEFNLLLSAARCLRPARLAQGEHALLGTWATSVDHNVVLLDFTVVWEATHGSYGLLGWVLRSTTIPVGWFSVLLGNSRCNTHDFLVSFGTVMVTILTSTRH